MSMRRREFLKIAGLAPIVSSGATVRHQPSAEADYVIVGAGSAGCVLAYRISATPSIRVTLLEAGGSGEADPAVTTPGRWPSLAGSQYDWNHRTEPVSGLENRALAFPRGRAHGGSSTINAMIFVRGDRRVFDRWRDLGNPGWGYDDVLPLFKRLEKNETGASEYRGADGPLAVSGGYDPHAAHRAFLTAAVHTGYQSDARFDFNRPIPQGVAGFYQKNILDEKRHSSAAAFLAPALARPNLTVHSGVVATKLLIEGGRAVGVEYLRDGQRETVRAAREIILCSGVVGSPALLMRSGIGPADHLRSHGIAVVADVGGVGGNFQDHLQVSVRWQGKTELPGSSVTAGLFTHSNPVEASTLPADLQFHVGRGSDEPDRFVTITASLVRPKSRGEVRLRSANPADPPLLRANLLQEGVDVGALVRGVHLARWFASVSVYDPIRGEELEPGPAAKSDADLERFVRRTAESMHGGASTCRMGPSSEPTAVVDPELRVRGVQGLRVADASIMPEIVTASTHATCVMIGEKAADLLAV